MYERDPWDGTDLPDVFLLAVWDGVASFIQSSPGVLSNLLSLASALALS